MSETRDLFPSDTIEKDFPTPHGWIQWKGTDVCMDITCTCGFISHFHGEFCYHVKCPKCGQVYECSGFFRLHPLDFEPENTKETLDDAGFYKD